MIYDFDLDMVPFENLACGQNFTNHGQLYLKLSSPTLDYNCVNLSDNHLSYCSHAVKVKVVNVKIVDVAK